MTVLKYLDDKVLEWSLFCRVQPLFASAIPWQLCNPKSRADDICLDSFRTCFSHDICRAVSLGPRRALSQAEFTSVLDVLNRLLVSLEGLVLDTIEGAEADTFFIEVGPSNSAITQTY